MTKGKQMIRCRFQVALGIAELAGYPRNKLAEAISANPGTEFISVLSVSFPETHQDQLLPTSLVRTKFQLQKNEGRNFLTPFNSVQSCSARRFFTQKRHMVSPVPSDQEHRPIACNALASDMPRYGLGGQVSGQPF